MRIFVQSIGLCLTNHDSESILVAKRNVSKPVNSLVLRTYLISVLVIRKQQSAIDKNTSLSLLSVLHFFERNSLQRRSRLLLLKQINRGKRLVVVHMCY
jgi:hypothetical protein